jgi:hypothetical protein
LRKTSSSSSFDIARFVSGCRIADASRLLIINNLAFATEDHEFRIAVLGTVFHALNI